MKYERAAGILLHPTSLPGPYGIGDLGPEAFRWIDFLADTGCTLWQVLPLGPTGYGDSPYQSFSAFAGNPYLVSPALLVEQGLLQEVDLKEAARFPRERVDYGAIIPWKINLLSRAHSSFLDRKPPVLAEAYAGFQEQQRLWLDDYALFMALKEYHGGIAWLNWEPSLRDRRPDAIERFQQENAQVIGRHKFFQFLFFQQWQALRTHAKSKNIQIIGDAPIFVAMDSADVWAHRELFYLDPKGNPEVVAGVPPDYFSPTGQLWGNPLYIWEKHKTDGYLWWIARLSAVLQLVDIIRLDHFRGFAGYWEVPAAEKTAENGRWVPGPGADFFHTVRSALGELPLIAEDLGEITPDVIELRDAFELPGMKVLQFAFFGNPDDLFLPHNYSPNCVVYTGTHDNNTTLGWFQSAPSGEREFCLRYLGRDGSDVVWNLIRLVWSSVAMFAVVPLQDLLVLGSEARMNYPGQPSGNWTWRMPANALNESLRNGLKEYNFLYSRRRAVAKVEEVQAEAAVEIPEQPDLPSA